MESAVELEVPNKVDYESGENWGNIKQEKTMEQLKQYAIGLWGLARANKKVTFGIIVAILILYTLVK